MKRKILIVDDSDMDLRILSGILSRDYDPVEASSGREALEIIETSFDKISAVILDVIMPEMTGYEFLEIVREKEEYAQIPIIVATSLNDEESQEEAIEAGANGFVIKPYNPTLIRSLLQNSINLRETAAMANALKHDKLTGLYTRDAFFDLAEKMIHHHEPGYYILASFDIDNFKVINDQYGNDKGDEVLRHVAECIRKCAMSLEGICSRVMADKFALLYPTSFKNSQVITDTHRNSMNTEFLINRNITVRIGRFVIEETKLSLTAMLDRATLAEDTIRGIYDEYIAEYNEEMRNDLIKQQQIVNDMNGALIHKQFEVWLQPQYNHRTGAITGAEALVRWRHPTKGLVAPNEFIPIFEKNGFVYEVDKYVWEKTCMIIKNWIDTGSKVLPISVNISRFDLFHEDFIDTIVNLVKKYEIPIDYLRLEITESAFSKSTKKVTSIAKKLVDLGFTLEIDDFGSGYSSLNTLKDVPASVLKLDMQFMSSSNDGERGGSILEAIVRMAKWLGMSVIAEGVETEAQADFLRSIGCYYIQGYFYSKPVAIEDFETLKEGRSIEKTINDFETVERYDNISFWNPDSINTLVFNNYIGGACVIEYHSDKLEILRYNEGFIEAFENKTIKGEPVWQIELKDCLDEINYELFENNISKAVSSKKQVACEITINNLDDGSSLYLNCMMRLVARTTDRFLVYLVLHNISDIRNAERKEMIILEKFETIVNNVACGITAISYGERKNLILSNELFFEIVGHTKEEYEKLLDNGLSFIHPEDEEKANESFQKALLDGTRTSVDYRIIKSDGTIIWVRNSVSFTRLIGVDNIVKLSVYTDITKEYEAIEEQAFINKMAKKLLLQTDFDKCISDSLTKLLAYFKGKKAFLSEFDMTSRTISRTYEECVEGGDNIGNPFELMRLDFLNYLLANFYHDTIVYVENIDEFDNTWDNEKQLLANKNVKSFIATTLSRDGKYIGFVGVSNPEIKRTLNKRLSLLGEYLVYLLARRDLFDELVLVNENTKAIMDGVPGGFASLLKCKEGYKVLYFSDGLCRLVKIQREKLIQIYSKNNLYARIHPDDIESVMQEAKNINIRGEARSPRFRYLNGHDEYIYLSFTAKIRTDKDGNIVINLYYVGDN